MFLYVFIIYLFHKMKAQENRGHACPVVSRQVPLLNNNNSINK